MNTNTAPSSAPSAAPLQRDASQPLAHQLAQRYAERIRQRLLLPGARLPSVRECARHHGVSPHTVVAAYDQLQAEGLLEARRQRGFFVRETRARQAAPALAGAAVPRQVPLDATTLIRGMFGTDTTRAPGSGVLPADWLDIGLLQSALRRAQAGSPDLHVAYGEPAGDARLRLALTRRLADLGIQAGPEQLLTTAGATQALDLITRGLLQPGDAVLVDDPGWAVEFARLANSGMRLLPVPRHPDGGPDLAVMQRLAEAHHPRAYVTVSVLHNPTGSSLTAAQAHTILKLADQHDLLIVEDDTYAFLAPEHTVRLSALDGLKRTIYVSGFSKFLSPAWRVGYLAASPERTQRLIDLKLLSNLTSNALPERAVAHVLDQGQLRRHAERVQQRLDAARTRSVALAERAGARFVSPPRGLFGWIDVGVDTERLAQPLLDAGWLTAPGVLFSATRQPGSLMRINFATAQTAAFWRDLQRCVEALRGG
ncbi:PLP-dependent aminotransferase family protein [Roseateles sp.]|uniref:aminotransferase-like domain-containing protein n=1 Tax=Roseateles sp. TaxID=1971397 RepID=UPI0039244489